MKSQIFFIGVVLGILFSFFMQNTGHAVANNLAGASAIFGGISVAIFLIILAIHFNVDE